MECLDVVCLDLFVHNARTLCSKSMSSKVSAASCLPWGGLVLLTCEPKSLTHESVIQDSCGRLCSGIYEELKESNLVLLS